MLASMIGLSFRPMTNNPPPLPTSADYPVLWPVATRWADNDHYGHVNNVTYYSYFDTAVNAWLIRTTGVDIRELSALGVVAETSCRYHAELSFPDQLQVGISIERLGTRSIVYSLAIFRENPDPENPDTDTAQLTLAATGRFVHVYVDAATRTPVPIPEAIRTAVERLL